ncbi:hypothetical protein [Piscirickettsia salmonis]|uniref:hypothetical protein n=1 Tax=Piscirickettsia salmonis TaxID=1238 RepID=UPI0012BAD6CE|nr:hypothetical protein [Piscirickettsia salmonis]
MSTKIKRSRKNVFTTKEFARLASYRQVLRVLKKLTEEEQLIIKLGYGLYAKARKNKITGCPMLAAPGGFEEVATEALNRLNVSFEATKLQGEYNRGSTQIPGRPQVKISGRFSRKIETGNYKLEIER